ncbi:MAG: hypothetical protein HUK15_08155 [Bacteroidales bacterium]|nr:hypothetical protein [Bacteroidales bacterium]
MKKIFLFVLTICLCLLVNAQQKPTANFGFDRDIVLEEGNDYVRMLGGDSDGFYAIRIDGEDKLWLEYFNAASLVRESSGQIILPIVEGNQTEYVEAFYVDGVVVLFTQVVDFLKKEKLLYIQELGKSGQVMGEPRVIGKLTNQNMVVDFNICLTPNGQNIFVWYNRPFQTYNEEPFYFKMFNSNLREVYNKQIKLPLVKQAFAVEDLQVTNSGSVYMLARISPTEAQLQKMKIITYDYKMLVYNPKYDDVSTYDVKDKKLVLVDAIFGIDSNENIDVFGFLVPKGKTTYTAIYHQKIDVKEKKLVNASDSKKAVYNFQKSEIPAFNSDRLNKIPEQRYDYQLLDVHYLTDGGSMVVAEHKNYWKDSIFDPQTRETIYNEYYRFNDVIVAYCNQKNCMEWMVRIPKTQYSYNDFGKYSSVATYAIGEKLFLFYNDNPKNLTNLEAGETKANLNPDKYKEASSPDRNGFAMAVSIFSDGAVSGQALFPKANKKSKIIPELFNEYNGTHYMFTRNGKKCKFAMFNPE